MNRDQTFSTIRYAVTVLATLAASHHWPFSGGIVGIGSLLWSLYAHSEAAKLSSVAANPRVRTIVADTDLAAVVDSVKVVPPPFAGTTGPK